MIVEIANEHGLLTVQTLPTGKIKIHIDFECPPDAAQWVAEIIALVAKGTLR